MTANQLQLTNVINISVSAAQAGVGAFNTSNLALFTSEVPAMSFGNLGYSLYLSPQQVGVDFGTTSKTYQMANAVFSQQPNILTGGGYLCVITMTPATQHIVPSGTPASGTFELVYSGNIGGGTSAAINWNDTAAQIQTKLQAIAGLSEVLVTGSLASLSLNVQFAGCYGVQSLLTVTANSVQTSAPASVTFTITTTTAGQTLGAAITATENTVQYFGVMASATVAEIGATDVPAAAAIIQALNKIAFFVSYTEADIQSSGILYNLMSASETQSRGLFYMDSSTVGGFIGINAILMMAAYAGRAMSTNFAGSNTTSTMNLKSLATIVADPNITQTIQNEATTAGADTYVSLQGVPKVLSAGANSYFDQVYNLQWFVAALNVAGFNYLATTSTKIPQTEGGMDGLKGAYRQVCQQAVTNQYSAPGTWNSATTFGNLTDFYNNISQVGYYIYSVPISQQSQTDRANRKAPLVSIALKQSGAIQQSSVIVNVNA